MNDRQNTVVATVVCGLILIILFLCPWRIESSGEIKWSPIYQPPMSYVRSYDADFGHQGGSKIESEEAEIAYGLLVGEVVLLLAVGGLLYWYTSGPSEEE